jgi:hypothetical protein
MKTKTTQKLSADIIAEYLSYEAFTLYVKAEYDMLDEGIHRKTWCACVYQLKKALEYQAESNDSEFDTLAFLDNAGFFEVADHEIMSDWHFCTKREDYIDEE